MKHFITASKLYDYTQCPHRVWRDAHGPQEEKIKEINPFVQLLWDKGILHEKEVIASIGDFLDLSKGSYEERFEKTIEAMKYKIPLIYQGLLKRDNLFGIPDLLKLLPDGSYIPADIKSGMGFEGYDEENGDEGKPKKHYAVQLALYVDLLMRLGFLTRKEGLIIDARKDEVKYDLESRVNKFGQSSFWDFYEQTKGNVQALLDNEAQNKPAFAGVCKLCPWYVSCKKWCKENDDLTNLFYLGRSKRDIINEDLHIEKIADFAHLDVNEVMSLKKKDKNFLKGVGESTLFSLVKRARIYSETKKPVAYEKIEFPKVAYELFFDIEDDPTQDFVYLHGVYERSEDGERFLDFTAKNFSRESEKKAWMNFWEYMRSLPENDFSVYYYSNHEKATYKKMQKQYPDVISEVELEDFFNRSNTVDLYKIVFKCTDWPVSSYSLKELAVYLGFKWRDETPSGALSIEWYNKYLENNDEKMLERILLYNEDDCKATMVLKDALENLEVVRN